MDKLEKHRLILYGRIGTSITLYVVSMSLGASAALTEATETNAIIVGATLVGAILLLPRRTVPSGEAGDEANDETLEHFRRIRRWLTWTRLAYLLVAIGVLVGLPYLL